MNNLSTYIIEKLKKGEDFSKLAKEYSKDSLDILLQSHNLDIPNAKLHDLVYVANWCKSVFGGSSIADEKHFVLFLKDIFEHEGDLIFNRWFADMAKRGIPIEWEDMI